MTSGSRTHAEIIAEVLGERAPRVAFTAADMEPRLARLRAGFARIDGAIAERERLTRALDSLPGERREGWLKGVQSSMRIVLDQARKTSEILVDAARDLLPPGPGAWDFAPDALVTRGAATPVTRVESQGAAHGAAWTVFVEDGEGEPRLIGVIRDFPAADPPPVALLVEAVADDARAPRVIECEPEVIVQAGSSLVRLRFEPDLPPGVYSVFFGNPKQASR